jgi:hypothetical protein
MDSATRIRIARWANANKTKSPWNDITKLEELWGSSDWATVGSLALWVATTDLSEMSDEELGRKITLQYGFAADEQVDPSKVIKSPDQLVGGTKYSLASNGYELGEYVGPKTGGCGCQDCKHCKVTDVSWLFSNGVRGSYIWEFGVY